MAEGRNPGGACFTWSYDGNPFELVATDLTSYLEVAAEILEAGLLAGGGHTSGGSPASARTPFTRLCASDSDRVRIRATALRRRSTRMPGSWPDHWLESVGPAADAPHVALAEALAVRRVAQEA